MSAPDLAWMIGVSAFWIALYVTPTLIAYRRRVVNRHSVAVVNLLLGWTVIGWIVALAMSVRDAKTSPAEAGP